MIRKMFMVSALLGLRRRWRCGAVRCWWVVRVVDVVALVGGCVVAVVVGSSKS